MNGTKVLGLEVLGLAAVGAMLVIAAPVERAQAASLINPGAAATVQQDARQQMTTEVRWHWRHHHHHHRWHWRRGHHHHHRHW
jgi:hypothetical protein